MGLFDKLFGGSPKPPRIVAHVAFDGAIRVLEAPTAAGWQPSENERAGDGFTVRVLKYILPLEPMPLALLAKIYASTGEAPADPKSTDWRAVFDGLFASVSNVEVRDAAQLTMQDQLPAVEAVLDGDGQQPPGPLRLRERRAVKGQEQFIVTAMGTPAAFDAHRDEVERWFSTSAFVPRAP